MNITTLSFDLHADDLASAVAADPLLSASFVFLASTPPSAGSDFFRFLTMCEMSLVAPFESAVVSHKLIPYIQ